MHIAEDYKNDPVLRQQFCELAQNVFSIDFEEWYQKGLWGPDYICHSIVDSRIISNVSVNRFQITYSNEHINALQISTVMTDYEYRHKGHAQRLMKHVIDKYSKDFDMIYLFTDTSNRAFYEHFGFKPLNHGYLEYKCIPGRHHLRQLDMNNQNDIDILKDYFSRRKQYSGHLTINGHDSVFYWHCLNTYRHCIYLDNDAGYIGIFKQNAGHTDIYDLLITSDMLFDEAICRIAGKKHARVFFDNSNGIMQYNYKSAADNDIMLVLGGIKFGKGVIHPLSAHA